MHSISAALPGFFSQRTRAPWPVWRGSVAGPVRFVPLSRKLTAKLWHKARQWDRETHQPGQHGGCVGRTALSVLYTIAFDFLNSAACSEQRKNSYAKLSRNKLP